METISRYDNYKDSGIEWIGEIPEHWETKRFRHSFRFVNDKSDLDLPKMGLEHIESWTGKLLENETEFEGDGTHFKKYDILFGKLRPYLAKVYLADSPGKAVGDFFVLRSNKQINPQYGHKLLLSRNFIEITNSSTFGSKMPRVSPDFISDLKIIIPPLLEQTAIATYLDRKTAELDQLIADKRRLLELYDEEKTALINQAVTKGINPNAPLKDSGIEWLGEIPEHWEVKKLKYLSKIISKGTTPSTIGKEITLSGDIRFIKAENISNNQVVSQPENYIDIDTNELLKRSELEECDILFVIAGATIGKVAILNSQYLPANTNQAISFIRLIDRKTTKFVWYVLQSSSVNKLIWLNAVQSAQPNLSMENLGNFDIPFPGLEEQRQIVQYIETETARIDVKTAKTEKLIDLLTEYRTALISEVVTGKVKVTADF